MGFWVLSVKNCFFVSKPLIFTHSTQSPPEVHSTNRPAEKITPRKAYRPPRRRWVTVDAAPRRHTVTHHSTTLVYQGAPRPGRLAPLSLSLGPSGPKLWLSGPRKQPPRGGSVFFSVLLTLSLSLDLLISPFLLLFLSSSLVFSFLTLFFFSFLFFFKPRPFFILSSFFVFQAQSFSSSFRRNP